MILKRVLRFKVFSNHFDMLISKIIFKNKKIYILMHFQVKNTLKNNRNNTPT